LHLYRAAGLEGASSQSGRRTFVTALARQGINTGLIKVLAGHRRVEATRVAIGVGDPLRDAIEGF
jgi:integrase/recombinase XerD